MSRPLRISMLRALLLVAAALALAAPPAQAQPLLTAAADEEEEEHEEVPGTTPRSATVQFLRAARAGNLARAMRFIGHPDHPPSNRAQLARQLRIVLDRQLWIDPTTLSDRPEGRLDDGLPAYIEEIGRIRTREGVEPIRLVRLNSGQWVFGRETLARVPVLYDKLPNRWLYEKLPEPLLRTGPLALTWWQWIALPILLIVSVALGRLVGLLVHLLLVALARRTTTALDDRLIERMRAPRNLVMTALVALGLLPQLHLPPPAAATTSKVLTVGLFTGLVWAVLRSVDLAREVVGTSRFVAQRPAVLALLPLGTKIGKIVLFALSVVMILQWWGLPVASLIAGLGLGGLAVALAAKTTLENLLSSVTLGVDQPFRPGDFVKVDDTLGTVESVGLRSTRIRTLDRTVVSLANAKVADMRIESYTARDRIRLATTLQFVYGTTSAQMRELLGGIEKILRDHPKIWPDTVVVRFKEFGASSLDVEVMAWFQTTDWGEFQQIRQDVYLEVMALVERVGTSFAFPTRTVHLVPADRDAAGHA